ncbi:MAG: restriction endonuclease subunit S, partial [Syntrophales bacterium]|nr:restriction endonuclease subunit S [Syntrophales bacterium]
IGKVVVYKQRENIVLLSSIAILTPGADIDSDHLGHFLRSPFFEQQIDIFKSGSALKRLVLKDIRNLKIIYPSMLDEQRKIAKILNKIDEAIQKTEQLITKLKAMKQGLLRDLLTRGIDESGKLRDPIAHPEQFKDSPLGKIPNEWEICRAYDVLDNLDNKRVPVSEDERNNRKGDVPYYGANGQQGWIDDYLFDEPLILLAEDGGDFDNFATKPVAYRIAGKSWVNNHAHVLRPKSLDDFSFLFFSLEHKDIRIFIKGGTRSKLNKTELNQILLKWPSSQEERKIIGQTVETIDCQKELELIYYNKLSAIKKGLMNDLLTGKVRVKI